MAKSRFSSAEEWNIKREIDRINRQIRQAFTKLGEDSRLAQQYTTLLQGSYQKVEPGSLTALTVPKDGKRVPVVRLTQAGIPQIGTGKAVLQEFAKADMQKKLKRLSNQQTVSAAQKAMIAAFEKKTGQEVKTRAEKKAAIASEVKAYRTSESIFDSQLKELYKIRDKRGIELKAIQDVKKISKGRWTSEGELAAMKKIVADAIRADGGEEAEEGQDVFGKNQW